MQYRRIGVLATLLLAGTASAHHSTAGYDPKKTQTVTGVVKKFHWVNPHIFIYLEAPNEQGGITEWTLEAGTPNINIRNGWKPADIKAGDKITVQFHPSRNSTTDGQSTVVTLANGEKRYSPGYENAPAVEAAPAAR